MPASLWKRWAMPAAVALALVPLVASAIALIVRVGDDYLPSADQAWIELQIRDIGQRSVLLGPYSRFGWFHPGPILYYLLWLPYRITGSTSLSLCFAALTLNAVALVGIALVAKRRGGLPLVLLTLFLTGLLMSSLRRAVLPRRVEPEHHDPAVRARRAARLVDQLRRGVGAPGRRRRRRPSSCRRT